MGGLARICKMYGRLNAIDKDGTVTRHVWDYAADKAVTDKEMPFGSERWKASEIAKADIRCTENS